jgi:hypothetical protein
MGDLAEELAKQLPLKQMCGTQALRRLNKSGNSRRTL